MPAAYSANICVAFCPVNSLKRFSSVSLTSPTAYSYIHQIASALRRSRSMSMPVAEKVLARAAGKSSIRSGEYVDCRLDGIMAYQSFIETHTRAVEAGLPDGLPRVFDAEKLF